MPCFAASSALPWRPLWRAGVGLCFFWVGGAGLPLIGAESAAAAHFHRTVEPLLTKYCYDCHASGVGKGQVSFDTFKSDAEILAKRGLWLAVLKNVRAGLMPPHEEGLERPSAKELADLVHWIKADAFGIDPLNPDPGVVTARRMNRIEYRNTIRDLLGYDFNSEVEFPPDDSGNGFDNNGNVLTLSPLLLEKYLAAAELIVDKAVPKVSAVMRERTVGGKDFRAEFGGGTGDLLNVRKAAKVTRNFSVEKSETYELAVEFEVRGSFDFDDGRARLIARVDGEEKFTENIVWSERRTVKRVLTGFWSEGNHAVSFEVVPILELDSQSPPSPSGEAKAGDEAKSVASRVARPAAEARTTRGVSTTSVTVKIVSVGLRGPLNPQFWSPPENYSRFFPKGPAPSDPVAREVYATELLTDFASRAFRRSAEPAKVRQLVALARQIFAESSGTFEEGIGRAMMAVLASPRFLFRIEQPVLTPQSEPFALIDEFSLASRLSYFLWSTMPDDELLRLASRGELRREQRAQVDRMLRDTKAQAFIRNFTGQWLQARDVEFVPINARVVLGPNAPRNKDGRIEFDGPLRRLMRSETEMTFDYVIREDRSVLELVDSDYTFLNERLAAHYGVPGVRGETMRRVVLPPASPRGGVLTQGTVLAVTSNPTRTSPVKRGLFILENILGTPPPPPPPDIPDLEASKTKFKNREPQLSEMLAEHRSNKLCHSCHARMDPLGLAMENFNALGGWRETEADQPIDAAGQLITGEKFATIRELKQILSRGRKLDVYRCLTEKLLTYALGRGLEYFDTQSSDAIVEELQRHDGKMSSLLFGIIESPAFQKQRLLSSSRPSLSLLVPPAPSLTTPPP